MAELADLVEYLVASVVDDPSQVRVSVRRDPELHFKVQVAPGEEGRVIGRSGRVIQAIRTVVRVADPNHRRLRIDLVTPER
jgi:predicted RNA-binding protein YlqC (UPF0109 family)